MCWMLGQLLNERDADIRREQARVRNEEMMRGVLKGWWMQPAPGPYESASMNEKLARAKAWLKGRR